MNDHIDQSLNTRHVVAVTTDAIVETSDPNTARIIRRGVYSFTSEQAARVFTSNVNNATETSTAHYFTRNT